MKRSAATAALKTTENKSTSSAKLPAVQDIVNPSPKPAENKSAAVARVPAVQNTVNPSPKPAENKPTSVARFAAVQATVSPSLKPAENKFTSVSRVPAVEERVNPPTKPAEHKSTLGAVTTIEVKADVGFGNAVFLRGQGSGLTWERGVPLACVDGSTWRWSQQVAAPITFKVLLNDQVWSAGNDLVAAPGQKVEVSPSFAG